VSDDPHADLLVADVVELVESLADLPEVQQWMDDVYAAFRMIGDAIAAGVVDRQHAEAALRRPFIVASRLIDDDATGQIDESIAMAVSPDACMALKYESPAQYNGEMARILLDAADADVWDPTEADKQRYRRTLADWEEWRDIMHDDDNAVA
jgi:hypothetical protein